MLSEINSVFDLLSKIVNFVHYKAEPADIALLKSIWQYVNHENIRLFHEQIGYGVMPFDQFNGLGDKYLGVRGNPENILYDKQLERLLSEFDKSLFMLINLHVEVMFDPDESGTLRVRHQTKRPFKDAAEFRRYKEMYGNMIDACNDMVKKHDTLLRALTNKRIIHQLRSSNVASPEDRSSLTG